MLTKLYFLKWQNDNWKWWLNFKNNLKVTFSWSTYFREIVILMVRSLIFIADFSYSFLFPRKQHWRFIHNACFKSTHISLFLMSISVYPVFFTLKNLSRSLNSSNYWYGYQLTFENCYKLNVVGYFESPYKAPNPCTLSWRHGGTGAHFHKELVSTHVHTAEKMGYNLFPCQHQQHPTLATILWTFSSTRNSH